MKEDKVTCDGCGKDISTRSNIEGWRLVLSVESIPADGAGPYTCKHVPLPIGRTYHFCRLPCLDNWRSHDQAYKRAMNAKWDAWENENGTRDEAGRIWSYPSPPTEIQDQWKKESREIATEQFPLTRDSIT